jgi:hypothetical protein
MLENFLYLIVELREILFSNAKISKRRLSGVPNRGRSLSGGGLGQLLLFPLLLPPLGLRHYHSVQLLVHQVVVLFGTCTQACRSLKLQKNMQKRILLFLAKGEVSIFCRFESNSLVGTY